MPKYELNSVILNTLVEDVIKKRGVTITHFAYEMGVTEKTVYNWLNHIPLKKVYADRVFEMAKTLGLNPDHYKASSVPFYQRKRWSLEKITTEDEPVKPDTSHVDRIRKENTTGWALDKLK